MIIATKCYPVSDVWLRTEDPNAPAYCDLTEIRNEPTGNVSQPGNALHSPVNYPNSAYLTWVLANDPGVFTLMDGSNPNRLHHILAARFIDIGIHVGDINTGGVIRGILKESNYIVLGEYDNGIYHNQIFNRIYRSGTTVGKLWILGC